MKCPDCGNEELKVVYEDARGVWLYCDVCKKVV